MKLVVTLALVALLAASCGKDKGDTLYTVAKTRSCLTKDHIKLGKALDFVASTATGGAFVAHVDKNSVTIAFGESVADADNIDQAYRRFRAKNVGIDDVLRQQGNAVMLWHEHPTDPELLTITRCLS